MSLKQKQAQTLMECLPYIKRFSGQTIVIKYGGHAMENDALKQAFAQNIALLHYVGINPVIVHGGGPQIASMLEKLGIKSNFLDGQRITDEATMEVVEMVLVGSVNNEIVNLLNLAGVKAIGLSGKDGHFIKAKKLLGKNKQNPQEAVDLGKVGEVSFVDEKLILSLTSNGFVPVIAPVGVDDRGATYNINADSAAGAVAGALKAKRMLLLTDVEGVKNREGNLLPSLTEQEVMDFLANGTLSGGMIPKIECCLQALKQGVEKAMIIDGRVENCILLELFTDLGIGTEFTKLSADKIEG